MYLSSSCRHQVDDGHHGGSYRQGVLAFVHFMWMRENVCVDWWVGAGVRGACGVSVGDRVCSYCDGGGKGQGVQEL